VNHANLNEAARLAEQVLKYAGQWKMPPAWGYDKNVNWSTSPAHDNLETLAAAQQENERLKAALATPEIYAGIITQAVEAELDALRTRCARLEKKMSVGEIRDRLNQIRLSQCAWEDREDIVTFNGNPIGCAISGRIEIDRWWDGLKDALSKWLALAPQAPEKKEGEQA
jgi:hypothetical protein